MEEKKKKAMRYGQGVEHEVVLHHVAGDAAEVALLLHGLPIEPHFSAQPACDDATTQGQESHPDRHIKSQPLGF